MTPAPRIFLVDPEIDLYRWVGTRTEADGAALVRVRHAPVRNEWRPTNVEWVRETNRRPICDFPIFYSIVRCFSRRAATALAPCTVESLEELTLHGLDDAYVGMHCIRWLPGAADLSAIDPENESIHSSQFIPKLFATAVGNHDVFGVPEMITKLFVSERFKSIVEAEGLVGMSFREVELVHPVTH